MLSRATAALISATVLAAIAAPLSTASSSEPTRGPSCGLDLVDDGNGETLYLEPITGLKNISCEKAQKVVIGARKSTNYRYICAKKTRYRRWTIRHIGYEESLSARFTKGNQRFRVDGQGSCK